MPFVFTVEDGTGVPAANSFVSVADADDILITNIHSSDWFDQDNAHKEYLLAWATRLLDSKATWKGTRVYETSGTRWPRSNIIDRDGFELADDEIPQRLKEGTAEMARLLISTDRTAEQKKDGLKSVKVDVIEVEFDEDYRLPSVPKIVWEILAELGSISSSGQAKIIKA
jgi:hypothetical protein